MLSKEKVRSKKSSGGGGKKEEKIISSIQVNGTVFILYWFCLSLWMEQYINST